MRSSPSRSRASRAIEWRTSPRLAVLRGAPPRSWRGDLEAWAAQHVPHSHGRDVDAECRALVRAARRGRLAAPRRRRTEFGGAVDAIDTRAVCLMRETLARHSGLADFAFAMQGLGSGAISLAGSAEQKRRYLPRVGAGEAIAAFALSEPDAGSDVAAMSCSARVEGDELRSSTARRPGSPTAASPTSTSCSRARAKRRERAASRPSSSMPARPASRSPSAST